ncbi:MAG: helicase [Deltaproteobacteria bacterium]|nr:MAG: helicase [Deltaproteobacteria bacterium]
MDHLLGLGDKRVVALLGPTNTGKTHAAIERMLGHRTGMIGLPLRLLAQEVYQRVVDRVGEALVALVTGEEKRVPTTARYWVCTVEAMPLDTPVHFLAIDEIQLMEDRVRGHVFTDRLLHARGLMETWFMGSDSAGWLITELVPEVEHERKPRLSQLTHAGASWLTDLPPRSAVVAFSAREVTSLAERLRDRRGGAAVVLGALSPRTRNAQVALFQSGEVPYLVATDAIGMGLNLDVHHVALAGLRKFDGISVRELSAAEVGQIAGRAGRHHTSGSFGSLEEVGPLDPDLVRRIERHDYPRLQRVFWRNHDLDTSSLEALIASLGVRPPHKKLVRVREAGDEEALHTLSRQAEVRRRAVGPERVALLWDVCRIPDFRKTLTGDHTDLLRVIYASLCDTGRISADFADRRLSRLDRADGGVDALTTRIAFVRTWATLAHRRAWFDDPRHWQERARAVEERLSDALHEELTRRFVERRIRRGWTPRIEAGKVIADGREVGGLVGLRLVAPGLVGEEALAVRAAASELLADRVEAIAGCADEELSVGTDAHLRWRGEIVGTLRAGDHPLTPGVALLADALPAEQADRIRERLEWWVRSELDHLLAPLRDPAVLALTPAAGAVFARLVDHLGVMRKWAHADVVGELSRRDWDALRVAGVLEHKGLLWLRPLHTRAWSRFRPALARAFWGRLPELPTDGGPARVDVGEGADAALWEKLGYVVHGGWATRLDKLSGRRR